MVVWGSFSWINNYPPETNKSETHQVLNELRKRLETYYQ